VAAFKKLAADHGSEAHKQADKGSDIHMLCDSVELSKGKCRYYSMVPPSQVNKKSGGRRGNRNTPHLGSQAHQTAAQHKKKGHAEA
jgi:hypothetical protein